MAHSLFGTGLCGPSKFFRDLWLAERFSGGARLNRVPKFAHCRAKVPAYSVSNVLILFSGRILGACIFKVHIYWLWRGWVGEGGWSGLPTAGEPTSLHKQLF